jgi:hypothetical protein
VGLLRAIALCRARSFADVSIVVNSWTEDLFVLFKVDGLLYLFSQTINNLITYSFKLYEEQDPSTRPFASLLSALAKLGSCLQAIADYALT